MKMIAAPPGRALDLGAGNGILSWALAQEGWLVTAVEPDPSDLVGAGAIRSVAKNSKNKIDVIEAFGESIPLEAAEFDLVVARQVLHHAHDLPSFCREMARLSRVGATVLTLRDHVVTGPEQLEPFLKSHPLHYLYGGENAFTIAQYRSALADAGLAVKSEMNSLQSVVNFDPVSEAMIRDRIAGYAGILRRPVRTVIDLLPFKVIGNVVAALDRRPGRLVSFHCRKS
jgi:SAM-dependent methyltransferase